MKQNNSNTLQTQVRGRPNIHILFLTEKLCTRLRLYITRCSKHINFHLPMSPIVNKYYIGIQFLPIFDINIYCTLQNLHFLLSMTLCICSVYCVSTEDPRTYMLHVLNLQKNTVK